MVACVHLSSLGVAARSWRASRSPVSAVKRMQYAALTQQGAVHEAVQQRQVDALGGFELGVRGAGCLCSCEFKVCGIVHFFSADVWRMMCAVVPRLGRESDRGLAVSGFNVRWGERELPGPIRLRISCWGNEERITSLGFLSLPALTCIPT
jgi:hypothetical protein